MAMKTQQRQQQSNDKPPPSPAEVMGRDLPEDQRPPEGVDAGPVVALLAKFRPISDALGTYSAPCKRVYEAIIAARGVQFSVADERRKVAQMMAPGAAQTVATMTRDSQVKGDPRGTEYVNKYLRDREIELTTSVKEQFREAAESASKAIDEAETELEGALAAGRRRAEFQSLSLALKGDDFERVRLLREELSGRADLAPVGGEIKVALQQLRDGHAEALSDLRVLVLAAEPLARDRISQSPQERKARLSQGSNIETRTNDALGRENAACRQILALAQEVRDELTPPELLLAHELNLSVFLPCIRAVRGMNAWDFPRSRFDGVTLQTGKLADALQVMDDWWVRHVPYGTADFDQVDAATLAKRGYAGGGPPGWGPKARGGTRVKLDNLVQPQRFGGSLGSRG